MLFITICQWTPLKCEISTSSLFQRKCGSNPRVLQISSLWCHIKGHQQLSDASYRLLKTSQRKCTCAWWNMEQCSMKFACPHFLPARHIFLKRSLDCNWNDRIQTLLLCWLHFSKKLSKLESRTLSCHKGHTFFTETTHILTLYKHGSGH